MGNGGRVDATWAIACCLYAPGASWETATLSCHNCVPRQVRTSDRWDSPVLCCAVSTGLLQGGGPGSRSWDRWEALLEVSALLWGLGTGTGLDALESLKHPLSSWPSSFMLLQRARAPGRMGKKFGQSSGRPTFWAPEMSLPGTVSSPSVKKLGFRLPMYNTGTRVPAPGQGTKAVG